MTIERAKTSRWSKPQRGTPARRDMPHNEGTPGAEVLEAFPPHPGRRMTEKEFMAWVKERTRAEWVNGEVIIMSPVNLEHDELQSWVLVLLNVFVEHHDLGKVCGPEFAVRLPNVPSFRLTDGFFVSHEGESKFERTRFLGAPDLIVEIVSPDSGARDYREKFNDYQAAGVREYWIIDPIGQKLEVHELYKRKYRPIAEKDGTIRSKALKGFFIKPTWLWQKKLPKTLQVLQEMGVR